MKWSEFVVFGLAGVAALVLGACAPVEEESEVSQVEQAIFKGYDTTQNGVVGLLLEGNTFCSGVIINYRTILTAGHCVHWNNGEPKLGAIEVGYRKESDPADHYRCLTGNGHPQPASSMISGSFSCPAGDVEIFASWHEQDFFGTSIMHKDLAILKFDKPLEGIDRSDYAFISNEKVENRGKVTAWGYGARLDDGSGIGVPRALEYTYADDYNGYYGLRKNFQASACGGDSGGPSGWRLGDGRLLAAGVGSQLRGPDLEGECGNYLTTDYYTRIRSFEKEIQMALGYICRVFVLEGREVVDCSEPEGFVLPDTWTCQPSWYYDFSCDCGCGAADVNCTKTTGLCDYYDPGTGIGEIPLKLGAGAYGLVGFDSLSINDGAKVLDGAGIERADAYSGGFARMGPESVVGNILVDGHIHIEDRARIDSARAESFTYGDRSSVVAGELQATRIDALAAHPLPDIGARTKNTQHWVRDLVLPPGEYGRYQVQGGTMELTCGDYYFKWLVVEPNAHLVADTSCGPVRVFIEEYTDLKGRVSDLDLSGTGDFLIAQLSNSGIFVNDRIWGATLYAPNAGISVQTAGVTHLGAIWARVVEFHQRNQLRSFPYQN